MNVDKIRADFPILQRKVKGKPLVYFDNAATSQKPKQVIDAMHDYYLNYNANVHRGVHQLSEEASQAYEQAHEKVGKLINAELEETVFTRGTTDSINMVAAGLANTVEAGDEIVVTGMEHHSNLVPWQQVAKMKNAVLKVIPLTDDGRIEERAIADTVTGKTKIVAATHMSNSLGTINNVQLMSKIAHENDALTVIDGAQSVPHFPVDVKKLDVDFLAFSAHKMLGPTGIGGLYGKKKLLEELHPASFGGGMIREVTEQDASWADLPWKFEAGTPPIAAGIGFGAAADYLLNIGMQHIHDHERKLTIKALDVLNKDTIDVYGPAADHRGGVVTFNVKGVHAHDVSSLLDDEGIAVRGGHHCNMPLMKKLGIQGSVRASFYLYNTEEELDVLNNALGKVAKVFS